MLQTNSYALILIGDGISNSMLIWCIFLACSLLIPGYLGFASEPCVESARYYDLLSVGVNQPTFSAHSQCHHSSLSALCAQRSWEL